MKSLKIMFLFLSIISTCLFLSSCCPFNLHEVSVGIVENKRCEVYTNYGAKFFVKISGECFYCGEKAEDVHIVNSEDYKNIEIGDYFDYGDYGG